MRKIVIVVGLALWETVQWARARKHRY